MIGELTTSELASVTELLSLCQLARMSKDDDILKAEESVRSFVVLNLHRDVVNVPTALGPRVARLRTYLSTVSAR